MLKLLRNRKGQNSLEYAAFIIIVMAAILTIQTYYKRGLQGRWKQSSDGIGEQYDPLTQAADINQTISGITVTTIQSYDTIGGRETLRFDNSTLTERKNGYTRTDVY